MEKLVNAGSQPQVLEKIKTLLDTDSDKSSEEVTFGNEKLGLIAGLFLRNMADKNEPLSVPVSYVEGKEIVVFAPVSLTFIEDVRTVDVVLLIPSQGTDSETEAPSIAKFSAEFKCFRNHEMASFEAGTPRRFAHFEIKGGYDCTDVERVNKAIALRLKANQIMPGKMTFEV